MFLFGFLILCELLLLSVSDAQNIDLSQNETIGNWTLGPEIRSVIPLDASVMFLDFVGLLITFTGVRTPNVDDPVIGYKLVIKKISTSTGIPDEYQSKKAKIKNIEGFLKFSGPKMDSSRLFTVFYKGSPSEINVPALYREFVYRIRVLGIEPKVHYRCTVRAFTKGLDGPVSMPAIGHVEAQGNFPSNNSRNRLHNYLPLFKKNVKHIVKKNATNRHLGIKRASGRDYLSKYLR